MVRFELIQRRSACWVANHCQTAAGGALISMERMTCGIKSSYALLLGNILLYGNALGKSTAGGALDGGRRGRRLQSWGTARHYSGSRSFASDARARFRIMDSNETRGTLIGLRISA